MNVLSVSLAKTQSEPSIIFVFSINLFLLNSLAAGQSSSRTSMMFSLSMLFAVAKGYILQSKGRLEYFRHFPVFRSNASQINISLCFFRSNPVGFRFGFSSGKRQHISHFEQSSCFVSLISFSIYYIYHIERVYST